VSNNLVARAAIAELEQSMFDLPEEEQVEIETTHHFAPGVYAREVFIPAGIVAVGKIHKTEHLTIVQQGVVALVDSHGNSELVEAPQTFVSQVGSKKAAWAIEDTVLTTIHITEETDLEKIELEVVAKTYDEIPNMTEMIE